MYADVIIPLALPRNYTWSVPEQWRSQIKPGCRVEVELRNKKYAGVVKRLHDEKPEAFEPKAIGKAADGGGHDCEALNRPVLVIHSLPVPSQIW